MKRSARIIYLLIIIVVVFSYLFSACYKYQNEHHDCCGEDCQICAILSYCEKTVKEFKIVPIELSKAILVLALFIFSFVTDKLVKLLFKQDTLVSIHIKMLN